MKHKKMLSFESADNPSHLGSSWPL